MALNFNKLSTTAPVPTKEEVDKKADKSDVEPLLFAQYYPEGNVKSTSEFTSGIKYDTPDTTNRTITVKPFCNTGTAANDNSNLSGRVVIPPFVDAVGNGYITDDGTRFKVVGVSGYGGMSNVNNNLTAIVAPNTVTTVGGNAFQSCFSLTSVSLPSATSIGNGAFNTCTSLASVSLPAVASVGTYAFTSCTKLASVSIPAATNIQNSAFYSCTKLTSVSIPAAKSIGGHVFDACTALASVSLPATTSVGGSAFNNCNSLASVSLPVVTSIDGYSFAGCTSLTSVDFGETLSSAPTLGSNAFRSVPTSCKIIVPDAQYDAWIAASGWSDLVTSGYKFLRHSEWEYARKYEVDKKADKPTTFTTGNLAALDSQGNLTDSQIPIDTSTLQGTTGPAPSSGYGTSGGIRVKPSIMGLTDGSSLVKGDRITHLDLKTGPNGVTEITNLYAYICDNNNAQYNNVIVGKSKLFDWPGSFDTAVQVEFEGGVSIDPDATYNILFSQTSKNIGDILATSECKTLRIPLVPIAQSPDYCCFNGSFSPLQGHQMEMTITYKRTMVANVPVSGAYGDAMESQWKFSPSYVQGYTITMNLMQAQDGVKATPYAAGGPASMSPITLQGDEETLTWNPMGSGISPEWYGSETLTATRIDKKQFVVGSQKDKKFQPAGVYLEANLLKGLTFDVTSNTDVQKALGAIITALGGEATNVPTT